MVYVPRRHAGLANGRMTAPTGENSDVVAPTLTQPERILFAIPIVAIVGGVVIAIVKMVIAHRERMALIEQGIHPDHTAEEIGTPDRPPLGKRTRTSGKGFLREPKVVSQVSSC